jgi:hypothetical protein
MFLGMGHCAAAGLGLGWPHGVRAVGVDDKGTLKAQLTVQIDFELGSPFC